MKKKKYCWKIELQKEQESAGRNVKIKTPTLSRYMFTLLVSETYYKNKILVFSSILMEKFHFPVYFPI